MIKSTESKPARKPPKPPKKFPLWAHTGSGQWAKKIGKQTYYFGSWRRDPKGEAALEQFFQDWESIPTYPYFKSKKTAPAIDPNACTLRKARQRLSRVQGRQAQRRRSLTPHLP